MATMQGQAQGTTLDAPPPSALRRRTVERTERFDAALAAYSAAVEAEVSGKMARLVGAAEAARLNAGVDAARLGVLDVAGEWLALAEEREAALSMQPPTLAQAVDAMWQAQATYEAARVRAAGAERAWLALDVMGSRVRRSAVKRLQESGLSATAADKAASDDDLYSAHKDAVAQLLDAKLDAEADRDGALQRLLSARATVEAFVQRERAMPRAEPLSAEAQAATLLPPFLCPEF